MTKRTENRLILLSAFLSGLSLPGNQLGLLSFISYAPLFYVLYKTEDLRFSRFLWLGYKFAFVFVLVSMYWIAFSDIIGFLGAQVTICLRFSILFAFIFLIRKYKLSFFTVAFLFVLHEFLYTQTELDYPWHMIAYALTDFPILLQVSELGGVYLVSFFIYLVNIFFVKLICAENKKTYLSALSAAFFVYLSVNIFLYTRLDSKPLRSIKVALLQPNIDPFLKWKRAYRELSINRLLAGTYEAINKGADHIILPETAMPYRLRRSKSMINKLQAISDRFRVNLTIGTIDEQIVNGQVKSFNSAFHFFPDQKNFSIYNKRRLVPVIEKSIYDGVLDFINDLPGMAGFDLGESANSFVSQNKVYGMHKNSAFSDWKTDSISQEKASIRFATSICIESNYPDVYRDFAEKGKIDLYSIITNDGWFFPHYQYFRDLAAQFGFSPYLKGKAAFQHHRIAVVRAIENRTTILRAANTGISSIIDYYGNTIIASEQYEEALILTFAPINPNPEKTFYQAYGDRFVLFYLAGVFFTIFLRVFRR